MFRLITISPVEEQVLARAQDKLRMDQMVIQSGSFNKDNAGSSDSQRKMLLQEILRQEIKQGNDAGAPNDEEINRMMARSEEEFATFQAMDKQIDEEDARVWSMLHPFSDKPCPGRFVTEDELPPHVKQVDVAKLLATDDEIPLSGKRSTARTDSYKDALSERDFMKAVQQGIDPITYAKQKASRGQPAAAKNRDLLDDDELLNYSDVEDEDEPERSPSPSSAEDNDAASVKAGSESDVSGINKRRKTANGHANTGAKAPKRPKAAPASASSSVSVTAPRVKKPAAPRGRASATPSAAAPFYSNGRSSLPPVYDDESPLNYDSSSSDRSDSYRPLTDRGFAPAAAAGSKRKAPASSGAGKARNNTLSTPSPAPFSIRIPLRSPPPSAAAASTQSPLPLPLHYSPLPSPLPSPSPSPLPPAPASRKPKAIGPRKKKPQQQQMMDMDDVEYEPLADDEEEEQPPAPAPRIIQASASGGLKLTLSLKRSP